MKNQEQLVRVVKLFGNGAHIFVPKEWAGEEIQVIKPQKKTLKEKIIGVLEPHLESIIGAYLYGSYARSEQDEDSDIDLIIITDKKIKIKEEGFEIICLEQKDITLAIKLEPLLLYSLFSEARPIINAKLLNELKVEYTPKLSNFLEFFEDCNRVMTINKEFLDSEEGIYVSGDATTYSLVLRLRGLFIIQSLLSRKGYTHEDFKQRLAKKLPEIDVISIYQAYRDSKNEKKRHRKIKVKDLRLLLEFLKNELRTLKDDKKREKARKRN